jgi:hypothetical protein
MTSSVCFSCKRFLNQHSNDELSKCEIEIIKEIKET